MPFDHNDHYHRLLLRQVPPGCRTALDVGCGTGRFARRLASLGFEVEAIDSSEEAVEAARASSAAAASEQRPRFRHADIDQVELPNGHYDFISCLASIHHMPLGTVRALRDALAPGGVLVILGCYPERTRTDWAWSLTAVPANAIARLIVAVKERISGVRRGGAGVLQAPVKPPTMSLEEIRQEAVVLLPGFTVRRLLFWRYLLVFRNPA
ncbi:class I SAM-dependent methyltransferase [Kitasatospora sp. NPDC059577]|uniref:class I SAM-dependent methyltransferase n=1 Tax=unclassified Kitasatospora TaxID=2633591 RepID=UPI0036C029DB